MILDLKAPWRLGASPLPGGLKPPLILLGLLYLQITYGAFVAGKRAGFMSSTFPDMNGEYLPSAFFTGPSLLSDLLGNPLALHYTHRALGALVLVVFIGVGLWLRRRLSLQTDRRLATSLIHLVLLQFTLGVVTVVLVVPTTSAVLHQAGAVLLLGALTTLLHRAVSGGAPGRTVTANMPI
jgi:cytochrome c oxidase assembly protein subunit 15